MSRKDAEALIRRFTRAFEDRDADAWVECFHPEAELLWPRNVLEGGSYRGHAGVRQAFADAFETWEGFRYELEDLRFLDDGALWLGQTVNTAKAIPPQSSSRAPT